MHLPLGLCACFVCAVQVHGALDVDFAAARDVARLCGGLPLFVTMVGYLIQQNGAEEAVWADVLEQLREDRGALLSARSGANVGSRIVESSLRSISDPDTREL